MKNKPSPVIVFRSLLFWALAASVLPLYNLLLAVVWIIPPRQRHAVIMSATAYFTFLLKYIGGISYEVTGLEHLPLEPAIIVSNHQSAWETVVFNQIFPQSVWIMKKEVLNIPFYGWGVRALSPIAIDRQRGEDSLFQIIRQGRLRM
jgi:1-acyl-sn-glycerol-3-phosphate acyltransferase